MDGFKAYKYYMAIKLHFTQLKYNVFENRGQVKGTRDTFNSRNDRFIFEKLASKYPNDKDMIQFFVSNFAYGEDTAFYGNEGEEYFTIWKKRKESITKLFIDDLARIINVVEIHKQNKEQIFKSKNGELPILLTLFLGSKFSIESLRIIDDIEPFITEWNNDTSIKIIMGEKLLRISKLQGFVKYDKEKVFKIYEQFKQELAV